MSDRMRRAGLWLRWSARDLRHRALLVGAISLLLALGTGLYTGLGSMETWRVASNDASFAELGVHDLRVELSEGSTVARGRLSTIAATDELAGSVAVAEERLIVPTQVEVEAGDERILVPGQLVGVDVSAGGPSVDAIAAAKGRTLTAADVGRSTVMLDASFADHRGLEPSGRVLVGDTPVQFVGHGQSPEYFVVTEGEAGFQFPGGFAVVFAPLPEAQRLSGRGDVVNDLVLRLMPQADRGAVRRSLHAALTTAVPEIGARITTTEDIAAHRILYRDAEGDQRLMNVFAALVLLGAALAAFNLISRVVESQRREIGIGIALGTPSVRIALRPALTGAQIALLGTMLGIVAGLAIARALQLLLVRQLMLPTVVTPFEPQVFARGALLSVVVVALATAYPVWRGVRMAPVDAIRVGARAARSGGFAGLVKGLRVPGRSLTQMPLRSVLRTPRRTAMTAGGIAAVIAVVVALLGTLDAFRDIIDRSRTETLGATPDRIVVTMDGVYRLGADPLEEVAASPRVDVVEPWLRVPGQASSGGRGVDVVVGSVAADARLWRPTPSSGEVEWSGLLLSELAADELRVAAGDAVALTHPVPSGPRSFGLQTDTVRVAGTHPDPFRGLAYLDERTASDIGLGGLANAVNVTPAAGTGPDDVARALVGSRGVASVETAAAATDALRDAVDQYVEILLVPVAVGMALALLIAFNSTAIGAEERRREHATMFAFGLLPRTPVALACVESTVVGLLGTAIGVGLGSALLWWIVNVQFPAVIPEIGARVVLSPRSLAAAALAGVVVVGLAPLLTLRRLRRTDVPSELRVVE